MTDTVTFLKIAFISNLNVVGTFIVLKLARFHITHLKRALGYVINVIFKTGKTASAPYKD